ncbi:MAG: PepSY domain-containing protein [Bacteroidota bacterium]
MLAKVWRYSHFALTLTSSIFILLAAITGAILAIEPIENKSQNFQPVDLSEVYLAGLLDSLKTHYDEVLELQVNENQFVSVSVISMEEDMDGDFYIDPSTGRKIGDIPPRKEFYEFITNLHRSLFLKSPGRILVGLCSFFLFLISLTGILLFIERQKGIKNIFKKIIKEDFEQFYHLFFGRWMLIPIIIISLSGVYLSLLRFSIIPEKTSYLLNSYEINEVEEALPLSEFEIFTSTSLDEVRKMEFPFSPEVDDPFILSLRDRELKVNQMDGSIIEELAYPFSNHLSELNFQLHTGRGSILWSLILLLASVNILFFLYSGGMIAYRRLRSKTKNIFAPQEAEYVILYGSENGSTREFASILFKSLVKLGKSVYMDELNAYQSYQQMQELIVLTSTYGEGDPPGNAGKFLTRFNEIPLHQNAQAAVVGFGSLAYPDFCQFALDVYAALEKEEKLELSAEAFLIHNRSYQDFLSWAQSWSTARNLRLDIPEKAEKVSIDSSSFRILEKTLAPELDSDTFLLRLQAKQKFKSGDLLAIYPPGDSVERLYSIAKIEKKEILLSVKRHELGVCSNYLYELSPDTSLQAQIRKNEEFYLPTKSKSVFLIANGTGIAPFLGMINEKPANTQLSLFWGGRTQKSFGLYKSFIDEALESGKLNSCELVFSREAGAHKYVQDLVWEQGSEIIKELSRGASIMICGSIAMQEGVLAVLDDFTQLHLELPIDHFQDNDQILTDCY